MIRAESNSSHYRLEYQEFDQVTVGRYVTADQTAYWDGKTETGEAVPSGAYFYRIETGEYTETRKMVVLKYPLRLGVGKGEVMCDVCRGKANKKGFGKLAKIVLAAGAVAKKSVLLCPNRLRLESN